ncbi:hypothetical protein [Chitinophaga ginsengisegetis]|uniref:hypothetical protein n=1 Tax=Chitinophaga ginsengisegetis TaxID=393003 RepID=UPI000DC03836|nr:hypothetical protein [Chitinophaga ginsengisegetis]MDR6565350.1 hypothetical protein [Chitinophaga ginsengisegetis]MDR6645078.1 hypothetical protein [Chitinophaga ginsengisegetis]MDR6652330.1 hypothetical protein [Chitinophaga ginsengisegetis]
MMNKLWLLLCACSIMILSCKNKTADNNNTAAKDSTPPAINKTPDDTVQLGNKTFFVYFIEKADFDKFPLAPTDSSEADVLAKDSLVKREGNKLTIQLENGKQRIMANNNNDGEDYIGYTYAGSYPAIKRKGFFVTYYEGSAFELVNILNGDSMVTWSAPAISPDKKYIITASMDLVAAFDPNGFQLFSVNGNEIKAVGEASLDDWGPGMVHWINNKTILSEYITIDEEGNTQIRYVKMVMQ